MSAWGRLLARNGHDIHRSRWRVAAVATAASVFQTVLGFAQRMIHGGRIARTPIQHAPVFVLGHWRSGTTLLHELLALDPRHAAPTTYQCFNPHHFLLTQSWLPRLLRWLLPDRRPGDRMAVGWDTPQEDEFALCLLGQPSPYERIAFPNRLNAGNGALDLAGLSPGALREWERTFDRLVRSLTYANGGRRLVLKSPPHSCRVPTLLKLFPDARFVHVVRDPFAVYASTLNLWRVLYAGNALQEPSWENLAEHILSTFERLDRSFEQGRRLIPPGHLKAIRFEDLVRDPLGQMRAIYDDLELGEYEHTQPRVERYLEDRKEYESGTHMLTAEERRTLATRWGGFIQRYGYATITDDSRG